MKYPLWLALATPLLLVACDNNNEKAEVAAEIKQAYEKPAKDSAPLNVGDIKAGKVIARQCVSCHGMDGVLANVGAPFISGLDQDYIVSAMLAYADGSRKNAPMKSVVSKLKPDQIADVSAYYANLKTPWHGANVGTTRKSSIPLDKATLAAGAALAARCNSCHGSEGNSEKDGIIPALASMPPEYFIPTLKSYFNGKREHEIMKIFGYSLNETEIKQLAAYYAMQIPKKPPTPTAGNAKRGASLAAGCAGCHNIDGNSLNPEIPHLSGQPAEYLVKALQEYRSKHRKDPMMNPAVRGMSDRDFTDLAAYYARQTPESPLQQKLAPPKTFDPIAQGKKIAGSCDSCHGHNGNSEKPGIPSLTGLSVKYLVSATTAYRDGTRNNPTMKKMVSYLSDTDIEKVAFYYAIQTPANKKGAVRFDAVAGKKLSEGCVACHGENGISSDPKTPSLAGQDAAYLAEATRAYASGARRNEAMASPAQALKAKDIINVTAYFASLSAIKPDTSVPRQPKFSIVEKCNRCHGDRGISTEPGIPTLAGQSEAYLTLAIKEYQDGTRKNNYMNAMSDVLSLVEIKAIAAYYARQKH